MGRKPFFQADGAVIRGKTDFGIDSSVWFNAVVRGDNGPITIGDGTNVQDNCTLHVDQGGALSVGSYCTIGHNAILHGCTIEDNVLIGMGAIVMNGAVIGEGSIVGAGAVVTERTVVPKNSLVVGIPARVVKELSADAVKAIRESAEKYVEEARAYVNGEIE